MAAETIAALLAHNAAAHGARDAIVDHHARLDHAALDLASAARAAWLVGQGAGRHHRIGLLMENSTEWVVNACAVMRLGAVLVPLSTLLRPAELAEQLAIAGVRHLVAAPGFRGRDYRSEIAGLDRVSLPSLHNVWWGGELGNGASGDAALARAMEARVTTADDLAVIFTSGSSAAPKGVIHTQGAAIRAIAAGLTDRCIYGETRLFLPMPLFWIGGFGSGLISALVAGATLLTEATSDPAATLAFLAREQATLFRGWPDQAARIAAHPAFAASGLALGPGSLDAIMPPAQRAAPGRRANVFGMTETFGPYCGYPLDRELPAGKDSSCGRAYAGVHLRIVDPDNGRTLPAGETGRIQIGGTHILRAICGREREAVFTADGWYDSGDLGRIDADGFLFFAGRADDMIKISGASVYPGEVERALAAIPGVIGAHVLALGGKGGAQIGAAVIADRTVLPDVASLANAARARLSAYKLPRRWLMAGSADAFPHTATGKIDRQALRALLASTGTDHPAR